jgi:phosphoglycerate dehydrogenase-like enzyme
MTAERLTMVAYIPTGVRTALGGDEQIRRVTTAHPRVAVILTDEPDQFTAELPRADAVLIWPALASRLAPALEPRGRLRWIQSVPAGVGPLLTPEVLAAEHVLLTSSKGPMGPTMAEHALMLMLALARNLPGYLHDQAERRWRFLADERPMVDVFGKTVLILGVGEVGGQFARMCKLGFQMHVLGTARTRFDNPHVDRYIARADLHAALGEADFVALCLALTPETERIIDAAALAAMRPTAYLVNVTRGGLVDEETLVAALRAGRIAGAGLDTTTLEPLAAESPLWAMENVIITPHIAPGRDRVGGEVVGFWCQNIRRFAEGESLLGVVDRQARY